MIAPVMLPIPAHVLKRALHQEANVPVGVSPDGNAAPAITTELTGFALDQRKRPRSLGEAEFDVQGVGEHAGTLRAGVLVRKRQVGSNHRNCPHALERKHDALTKMAVRYTLTLYGAPKSVRPFGESDNG